MGHSGKRLKVLLASSEKVNESHSHAADLDRERSQFRTDQDTFALMADLIERMT